MKILKKSEIFEKSEIFRENVLCEKNTIFCSWDRPCIALWVSWAASAAPRLTGVFFKGVGIWSERYFFQNSVIAKFITNSVYGDTHQSCLSALVFLWH